MLFNTIDFLLFLPLVIIGYYLLPHKFRWVLLLAASYFFYMCWKAEYIILIVLSTLNDWMCGLFMEKYSKRKPVKIFFLVLSLSTNLGLLFFYKYYDFFASNINLLARDAGSNFELTLLHWLLPVGISFYSFQTMSYSIDVYFGNQKAEKHLGYFALYVAYFPQLVAGPIERFSELTPQLKEKHTFSYENLSAGMRLILYGLFIKMVIADNLSGIVDSVYRAPGKLASHEILGGLVFYSYQIYSDFYGYSLVAMGSAKIMGVQLMDNFKTPYLSKNIAEFWQRWHISLSTWFRDYLYLPLGGNRVSRLKWSFNIMAVFLTSGIWHGANWTFLIWGALYGLIYLLENQFNRLFPGKLHSKPYSIGHFLLALKTFSLVTLIWVFFRSQSFEEAMAIFRYLFSNVGLVSEVHLDVPLFVLVFFLLFVVSDMVLYNTRIDLWLEKFPMPVRWLVYALLVFSIVAFAGVENFPFIYFQF